MTTGLQGGGGLPSVEGLVGSSVAARDPAAERHPAGVLIPDRPILLGVSLGLLALTRPDALLAAAIILGLRTLRRRQIRGALAYWRPDPDLLGASGRRGSTRNVACCIIWASYGGLPPFKTCIRIQDASAGATCTGIGNSSQYRRSEYARYCS